MAETDARTWSQAEQERVRRLAVVAVVDECLTQVEAARLFGVSRQAVSGWVSAYRAGGDVALAGGVRGRRPGEQQALSVAQQERIVALVRGKNPDQLRLPFVLWTREAVRDLIAQRCGVRLALTTVGKYLKRWGFTPQKPVRRAFEQSAPAVARWLVETYPLIAGRAKREGATVLWGDEMGLRSDHAAGRSFAPRGHTPVVKKTGRRFGCNLIQAISNRGELAFRVFAGRFTQEVFIDFLARLVTNARGRKLHLIVDGHPAHRGRKARRWIDARTDLIEVHFLPGYSPELNPAEYLNNDTKHAILTKRRPADQDALVAEARRHLHRRQKQPHVVRNFFRHPDIAYVSWSSQLRGNPRLPCA